MKPDNFSEQIRRKLESVEPEFREKDWTRMRQALGHLTPVFGLGSKAALMAAASLITVMVFGGVAYHQYHKSQSLQNQVTLLTQTVSTLRRQAAPVPANPAIPPPDTVYLTRDVVRYVVVPADRAETSQLTQSPSPLNLNPTEATSTIHERATTNAPSSSGPATQSGQLTQSKLANSGSPDSPVNGAVLVFGKRPLPGGPTAQRTADPLLVGRSSGSNPRGELPARREEPTIHGSGGSGNLPNEARPEDLASGPSVTELAPLASRPFIRDTAFYQEGMSRSVRRMRRLLTTASPSATRLARVEVDRSEPPWKVRGGNIVNLGWRQWGVGFFGELRLNTHWRIGTGLVSVNVTGGSYLTEVDYDRRTKQDFRRNFAPGIDPRHDIINITPKSSSLQIPFRVSYRIGLGSGWSLAPSAGLNLSISNREEIGFAYLRGPGSIESVSLIRRLPQQMLHTSSAALYLEKNWGSWALQLGPYASMPLSSTPSRLNNKTAGAAARLFYQIDWKKSR